MSEQGRCTHPWHDQPGPDHDEPGGDHCPNVLCQSGHKSYREPYFDPVNRPKHYNAGKIEVIDFIEDQGFGFHLGNAVKYIARAGRKGDAVEDLEKASWYLRREIDRRKAADQEPPAG